MKTLENEWYVAVIMRYIIFRSPGKPDLDKYFKLGANVTERVKGKGLAKGWQRAGKGHFLFFDQTTKGTLEAKGTVPFGRGLVRTPLCCFKGIIISLTTSDL